MVIRVTDATSNADGYHALSGEYAYDNNGNMNNDPSKGGATIAYNYLNLPKTVTFGGDDKVRYVYDATGVKHLKAVAGSTASNAKTVHYSGPFIYEDNDLKCIFTSAGRITPVTVNGNVLYMFEYNLTDHLGNVRVTFGGHSNGEPEVLQVTDYYPFGLVMAQQNFVGAENSMPNKYLYNGKELQDDVLGGTALDWYDYGARFYDPQIGRWHTVDPRCEDGGQESWTPYHYVLNNPVKNTDPDGKIFLIDNLIGAAVGAAVDYTCQVVANRIAHPDQSWSKSLTNVSAGSILVSAAAGAVTSGFSAVETISASVVKTGVNEIVANVASKAVVGAVKEGTGQVLDNLLDDHPIMEGVTQKAIVGAVAKQLDININNKNPQTVISRYGSGRATTHQQVNMVKTASKEITANKIVEKSSNVVADLSNKVVDKKLENK